MTTLSIRNMSSPSSRIVLKPMADRYSKEEGQGENLPDSLDSLMERYLGSVDLIGSARFFRMMRSVLSCEVMQ